MKRIATILCSLFLSMLIFAQNNNAQGQKDGNPGGFNPEQFFNDMKNYVIEKAQLTPNEATKAYPIVKEMLFKQHELQWKQRELARKRMEGQQLSDEEYGKIVEQILCTEVKMKQVEESYYKKLHTVLSWKKVYKVRDAINNFHMEALRKFQRGFGGGRPRNGGNH